MRLLSFAASLRRASVNKRLLAVVEASARAAGAEVDHADFAEFDMPLYNGDVQDEGFPEGAVALRDRILASDGIIIASPEYNYSIPGTLKNAIDWVSRFRPQPWRDKHVLLTAASGSMVGGLRGLWHLRQPLSGLGAHVYPDMFGLAQAHKNLTDAGELADERLAGDLDRVVRGFVAFAQRGA